MSNGVFQAVERLLTNDAIWSAPVAFEDLEDPVAGKVVDAVREVALRFAPQPAADDFSGFYFDMYEYEAASGKATATPWADRRGDLDAIAALMQGIVDVATRQPTGFVWLCSDELLAGAIFCAPDENPKFLDCEAWVEQQAEALRAPPHEFAGEDETPSPS